MLSIYPSIFNPLFKLIFKSPIEGSQTCLHLIHSERIVNGGYYADCKLDSHNKLLDNETVCAELYTQTMEIISPFLE